MLCPKCQANNSDDAVCCSLCFHSFKAKPAPAASPAAAHAPTRPSSPSMDPDDVTVTCYGFITLKRGTYLLLQSMAMLLIILSLIACYSLSDQTLQAALPPNSAMTVDQLRRYAQLFWWIGLIYESIEAYVILGRFQRKREELARS